MDFHFNAFFCCIFCFNPVDSSYRFNPVERKGKSRKSSSINLIVQKSSSLLNATVKDHGEVSQSESSNAPLNCLITEKVTPLLSFALGIMLSISVSGMMIKKIASTMTEFLAYRRKPLNC